MPTATRRARERRTILWGAGVVVVALLARFVVTPVARRWIERESALAAARAELRGLESLAAVARELEEGAGAAEAALAARDRRVLRARSATLAASALQAWVQDAADANHILVTRLDVAPDATDFAAPSGGVANEQTSDAALADETPAAAGTAAGMGAGTSPGARMGAHTGAGALRMIDVPATLAAYTDIEGLATLLDQLTRGPRVVRVERMTVQINPSLRGADDVLQITLSLRAPVVRSAEAGSP